MIVEVKNDCITEVMRYCRDRGFIKIDETEWKRKIFEGVTVKVLVLDETLIVTALGHSDGKLTRSSVTSHIEDLQGPNVKIANELTRMATDCLYELEKSQYVGFVREGKEEGRI